MFRKRQEITAGKEMIQ